MEILKSFLLGYFPCLILFTIILVLFDRKHKVINILNNFICNKYPLLHLITYSMFACSLLYNLYYCFNY